MRVARIVAAVIIGAGCSATDDVVTSKVAGAGTSVDYPVTRDQAFDICVAILQWQGANAFEEHRDQGYVFLGRSGAFVEEGSAPGLTRVTVLARSGEFSEARFHQDFRTAVEIVRAGRPLPGARPVNEAR
jgi:hypothetical protein